MRRRVVVLVRPELAAGASLASLPVLEAADGRAAADLLRALDEDVGVVLLEEPLHADLPEETRRALAASPLPLVVPFPGPTWAVRLPAEEYIVELLRQAIGYRVRIR